MSSATKNPGKSNIVKWIICFALAGVFFLIPIAGVYTAEMRNFFAIVVFVMATVAFGFFDMAIPGFMLVTLFVIFDVAPANVVFSPWSNSTTMFMLIGAFLFANVLSECGLLKRISYWTIIKLGGSFNGVVYSVFFAGMILAFLTFHNGFILEVFLAFSILKALNIKKFSKEAILICAAGAIGAYGVSAFVYSPADNGLIYASIESFLPDLTFAWHTRLMYGWPIFFACLLSLWVLTKIYKTKDSVIGNGVEFFKKEYEAMGPMSSQQKKAVVCTVILAAYLILAPLHKLPADYIFMVLPWIMIMPGVGVGTTASLSEIKLGVIFFISGCMAIGAVGAYVGLSDLITEVITPYISGLPAIGMMYAFLGVGALSNFALTPYAMLSALSAPFCQLALDLGLDPMFALMSLITSTSVVFMPHEVACYIVLFGFGYITMGDFVKTVGLFSLIVLLFMGLIVYPYWMLIGLV